MDARHWHKSMEPHISVRSAVQRAAGGILLGLQGDRMREPALRSCCMNFRSRPQLSAGSSMGCLGRAEKESGSFSMLCWRTSKLAPRSRRQRYLCSGTDWKSAGEFVTNRLWDLRTKGFWEGAVIPFRGSSLVSRQPEAEVQQFDILETELFYPKEQAVDATTPRGDLSPATVNVVEQFSRMNGLTGKRMRANFEAIAPVGIQNDARNLIEFCCFRYLVRSGTEFHPGMKDGAFRRLTFTTMLAWQRPYQNVDDAQRGNLPRRGLVGEEAFVRIAPAIAGAADKSTAHHLFRALVQDQEGLSLVVWDKYLRELQAVHDERGSHRQQESATLGLIPGESVICVGASRRQPVQMWSKNLAPWPGRLTLTDRALYFEANALTGHQKPIRLDLMQESARVERKKVGPFGAGLFDSAIAVFSGVDSEPWVVEFVDFGGDQRRDVWFAVLNEIISLHSFIREYAPKGDDPSMRYVYGSRNGCRKATQAGVQGIARLQAVQSSTGKVPMYPERLLQFSYMANAPCGDLVLQTLAVGFWAGRLEWTPKAAEQGVIDATDIDTVVAGPPITTVDGNVYLRKWMTSPSWATSKSTAFWKGKGSRGIVFGKNHVVGGLSKMESAVQICREQSRIVETSKATVDGALLKGIPNNIDLLKELLNPLIRAAEFVSRLKRWENPPETVAFLGAALGLLYRNWFRFVFPSMLLLSAASIFAVRGMKARGQLGEDFGKVSIMEQPPSNTIQQIVALKDALSSLEHFLQDLNIALLKFRTLGISGQLQATNVVILGLVGMSLALLFVPFRLLLAFFLLDQFTSELEFRRASVKKMLKLVRDWWATIPASPVIVLPRAKDEGGTLSLPPPEGDRSATTHNDAVIQALQGWLGEEGL